MKTPPNAPRGIRNHNPGNVERRPGIRWQGQASDQSGDPRFVVFESPKWGIRAIARILITYQDARRARDGSRIDTIREIVDRWAPPAENRTDAYARHVAALTAIGEDEALDVYDFEIMKALIVAIIVHENSYCPYPTATIEAGIRLAGLEPKPRPLLRQADVAGAATAATGAATLLAALADQATTAVPQATQSAQAVDALRPGWGVYALAALILLAALVAIVKQVKDRQAGARH